MCTGPPRGRRGAAEGRRKYFSSGPRSFGGVYNVEKVSWADKSTHPKVPIKKNSAQNVKKKTLKHQVNQKRTTFCTFFFSVCRVKFRKA